MNGNCGARGGAAYVEVDGGMRWPLHGPRARRSGGRVRNPAGRLTLAGAGGGGAVPGEIVVVEPTGAETELLVQVGETQVTSHTRPAGGEPGDRMGLAIDPGQRARVRPDDRRAAHR